VTSSARAIIPIVISAFAGVKTNEARFLTMARSFSASRGKIFSSIVLPGTVPYIFAGLKYAAGRALLGVVVGELYAATAGVGLIGPGSTGAQATQPHLEGAGAQPVQLTDGDVAMSVPYDERKDAAGFIQQDDFIDILVDDDGPGIRPSDRDRAFRAATPPVAGAM